jgi:hypothetical protein
MGGTFRKKQNTLMELAQKSREESTFSHKFR